MSRPERRKGICKLKQGNWGKADWQAVQLHIEQPETVRFRYYER